MINRISLTFPLIASFQLNINETMSEEARDVMKWMFGINFRKQPHRMSKKTEKNGATWLPVKYSKEFV